MNEYFVSLAGAITRLLLLLITGIVTYILIPFVQGTVIPWLKEKRVYTTVVRFVKAAEKLGETGGIDKEYKRRYVENLLKKKGIEITPEVSAMIEAAVEELDLAKNGLLGALAGENKESPDGEDDGEDDDEADADTDTGGRE